MASSFKCPWGVKAQFTIPFKNLFYYRADKRLGQAQRGRRLRLEAASVIQQICYFRGHTQHRGVSLKQTYCILQDGSLESHCRAFGSRHIDTLWEKTIT